MIEPGCGSPGLVLRWQKAKEMEWIRGVPIFRSADPLRPVTANFLSRYDLLRINYSLCIFANHREPTVKEGGRGGATGLFPSRATDVQGQIRRAHSGARLNQLCLNVIPTSISVFIHLVRLCSAAVRVQHQQEREDAFYDASGCGHAFRGSFPSRLIEEQALEIRNTPGKTESTEKEASEREVSEHTSYQRCGLRFKYVDQLVTRCSA